MQRAVLARGRFIFQFLQVVRQDDGRDLALRQRRAHRAIDQMAHLRRHTRLLHESPGDVLEHRNKIEFLLIVAAKRGARLLPGDREHRHVVHARVVQAGQEMRRAGTRSRNAHAEFAGKFGMRGCHECGHFFVACLNEFDLVLCAIERAEDAVDAVARISEDTAHAPRVKTINQKVADGL
ncbi:hypothetical protein AWB68_08766 [Caballeronia choica]|uniref:Uncharacterized protein n=1 Tax=Caballeronia choica TaxID=326476 RepID=A0A158L557_9BURK|nr:hypothetical protein AWB68_08766 [Caballeronia choica]